MDLKQEKPIHLRCPKCGYDFSYNTNHIEEKIDSIKQNIASAMSQIKELKAAYPNNYYKQERYRRAQAALAHNQKALVNAKKARKATAVEIQKQVNKIFYQLVCEKIGKDEALKLMQEAEDQLVYYTWDMATQTFTRFEKA